MEDRSFGGLTWILDLGLSPSLFFPYLCLFILLDQLLNLSLQNTYMGPTCQVGQMGRLASARNLLVCTNCSVWPVWTLFWEELVESLSDEELWASLKDPSIYPSIYHLFM